jgi:dolichyl-phosphate beta-glucosyltransferase
MDRLEAILKNIPYSIVIPAYNEGERLRATLEKVLGYVHQQDWNSEVIVVNDGSLDDTINIVQEFVDKDPTVRLVENHSNRGKGYSVANGMMNARGDVVIFSDADLASPIEELPKLLDALASGADIAIGSRWLDAGLQTRRQSLLRQLFGRTFNVLMRMILGLKFKDTQCGFKAFTRRAIRKTVPLQRIEGWGFDPELLFLARKFDCRVKEVPVLWADQRGSRLHPFADGMAMFQEMVRIRWYDLTGRYDGRTVESASSVKTLSGVAPRHT